MKKIVITMLMIVSFINIQAQNFQWAKKAGSWAYDYGNGISTDNGGNAYIAGKYEMNANFNGTYVPCQGNHDIFLAKYTPSGALSWVRTAGGPTGDYAKAVACDGSNFVYVAGEIEGNGTTIKFIGTSIKLVCKGWNDAFLAKYDLNGNLLWAKSAGGFDNDEALGVTYDNAGNVYICGFFMNKATFGSTSINGYGGYDICVAKYDMNGNFLWVRKAGGSGHDEARSIKCDAAGNVYVCGVYKGTATFGSQTLSNYSGYFDGFLAKYDPNGTLIWVKKMGGKRDDAAWSLTMDNAGLIYVAGEFNSNSQFGGISLSSSGDADAFVACYNSSGNALWAKRAGGFGTDRARGIGCDGTNLYITGQFSYNAAFGSTPLSAADNSDIFMACLNNSGNFLWAKSAGGISDAIETVGFESGCAITAKAGSVYATGSLLDGGTFGSSPLNKFGRSDIFLTKISTLKSMQVSDSSSISLVSGGVTIDSLAAKTAAALTQSSIYGGNDSTNSDLLADALDDNTDLIPRNSSWKYLDNGTNQGTDWKTNSFVDKDWKTGNADFGYGNGTENTLVSYGTSPTNKYITTYFRKNFTIEDKSTISGLELSLIRDDGALVYINGEEVYRTNLPAGMVRYNTLAPEYVEGKDEFIYDITNISSASLINGNNLIAVEIHQNALTSSDISFNLKLNTIGIHPNDTLTSTDKLLLANTLNENPVIADAQLKIPEDNYDMIVYPNPTTGQFNLELCIDYLLEKTLIIEISNSFGKTVYRNQPKKVNGCVNEVIELDAALPIGVYVMKVSIDNVIETKNMLLAR